VQYIAVQSGWGVDAQRMQDSLDKFRGTKTDVPQGGVIWVFAVKKQAGTPAGAYRRVGSTGHAPVRMLSGGFDPRGSAG